MLCLAEIFQDKMMLQREKKVSVWGRAEAGKEVRVRIQKASAQARADADGKWKVVIPPLEASYSEEMEICAGKERIVLRDVAVGEIWIGAGQSNMEFPMLHERNFQEEKKNVPQLLLRFYDVPEISYEGQREAFDYTNIGIWREAGEKELAYFSAVGYYFQKELANVLKVPTGIVGCNWGGTNCCAWMSREAVERTGKLWIDDYEKKWLELDEKQYWEQQNHIRLNDTGNPAMDDFSNFMLPQTPEADEIKDYMEKNAQNMELPQALSPKDIPGSLYEHMVKGIAPFAVKGVLWYQGEGEDKLGEPQLYEGMLKALIKDWRNLWNESALPFLIIQLPAWERWFGLENHGLNIVRYCQEKAAEGLERVWLSGSSDLGERFDIHPKEKRIVGQRLALLARGKIYGEEILCEAPRAESIILHKRASGSEKGELEISFSNAEGGLEIKGERLNAMRVFCAEKEPEFSARVEGNRLILAGDFPEGIPIRLAFAQDKWFQVNLYNKAQLPALPFEIQLEK